MGSNLRERQVAAIEKMLTISSGGFDTKEDFGDQWKVLVYDAECRDIISPLMNLGSLRQKGVTLHMLLDAKREPIVDAPAVYFVRPTEENLARITQDCSNKLYRTFHLHFVTRIERPLLESFARGLVEAKATDAVAKIYDEYLDLISLEPTLFSLNMRNSFVAYNDAGVSDAEIHRFMGSMSMGLLSMVRTAGVVPYIRAPRNGAAEMLANQFCNSLRENLGPRGPAHALLAQNIVTDRPRPLMLIFDRTVDLTPPLLHTSTYQALVDDLLEHALNRVTVEVDAKAGGAAKKKTYDLNTEADPFYAQYAGAPFPEAVEANEQHLASVSKREAEIRSRPGGNSVALPVGRLMAGETQGGAAGETDLSQAIESLPDILAKKKSLEAHTSILQSVMSEVAAREVPSFFELEQTLITGSSSDRGAVLAQLADGSKGSLEDKARLLLVAAILGDKAGYETDFEAAFTQGALALSPQTEQGVVDAVLGAVAFTRRLQSLQTPLSQQLQASTSAPASSLDSFLQTASTLSAGVMAKAASFFSKFGSLYVTQVVEAMSEGRACPEQDSYCCLDPRSQAGSPADFRGQRYSDIIVFMVGGGCYTEYFNLQELRKHKTGSSSLNSIVYGCSEMVAGRSFLRQLSALGQKNV
jgi:hypothetical protein